MITSDGDSCEFVKNNYIFHTDVSTDRSTWCAFNLAPFQSTYYTNISRGPSITHYLCGVFLDILTLFYRVFTLLGQIDIL